MDTNVISEGAPSRGRSAGALVTWMETHSADLFLSAVSVAEIEDGIAKARRHAATRKAADLSQWFEVILHLYGDRILAFDASAGRIAGALLDLARSKGMEPGFADIIIAATARLHGLTILTRNTRHFDPLGIDARNPFNALP